LVAGGKQILFTGVRPATLRQIYFLSADGGGLRAVLPEGREAADADGSPDATQIVRQHARKKDAAQIWYLLVQIKH